jgi:hypothetical protein
MFVPHSIFHGHGAVHRITHHSGTQISTAAATLAANGLIPFGDFSFSQRCGFHLLLFFSITGQWRCYCNEWYKYFFAWYDLICSFS